MNPPKRRVNLELLLGISATFLSLAALVVSVFQTKIAHEQQKASVWPYLQTNILFSEGETSSLALQLINNCVGPALIKQVDVTYQGKRYDRHWKPFPQDNTQNSKAGWRGLLAGMVLKSSEVWDLYKNEGVFRAEKIANDSTYHLRIIYSDVYGNYRRLDRNKVSQLSDCLW